MQNLQTLFDWIRFFTSQFQRHELYYGHGTDNAFDEAVALVLGLLHLPYDWPQSAWHTRLTDEEKQSLIEAMQKRVVDKIPVPYLTNRTLYGGLEFYVDERVLIPRSPIVELIEKNYAPYHQGEVHRILDLCCGSGCIGLVALSHQPEASLVLSDIDADALEVAAINAKRFGVEDWVEIVQGDGLSAVEGKFDVILCNPPYVEEEEMEEIAEEYHHEPRHALVSGADGLDFTRRLLREAAHYLQDDGILILEVGMTGQLLEEAFPECDFDWVSFERGGVGVCVIRADELHAWNLAGWLD
ncbi:MAG: 50S ribosomal protein L3 N(5)-glutamine methyltransferase [Cardiobacteriaceae bacterium]|nr:50S ribosomal protein L3 N(5)-glutamine methyltransferase [Cardiobacteriaceae bacterium]